MYWELIWKCQIRRCGKLPITKYGRPAINNFTKEWVEWTVWWGPLHISKWYLSSVKTSVVKLITHFCRVQWCLPWATESLNWTCPGGCEFSTSTVPDNSSHIYTHADRRILKLVKKRSLCFMPSDKRAHWLETWASVEDLHQRIMDANLSTSSCRSWWAGLQAPGVLCNICPATQWIIAVTINLPNAWSCQTEKMSTSKAFPVISCRYSSGG